MPKHESLAAALAAFQAELPRLRKDETAKVKGESADGRPVNYSYGYADLAQVVEAVSTCLGQHGLAFTAFPTMLAINGQTGFSLEYALVHEGGEERNGSWPLPDPMRTKPQQLGSAITYARRYAQMAVTNTFPDKEDDDGAAAVPANHDEWANARPRTEQAFDQHRRGVNHEGEPAPVAEPAKPVKTSWTDDEVAEYQAKLTQVDLNKVGAAYDWMASKDLHNRGVGASGKTATLVLALRLADTALTPEATPEEIAALKVLGEARGLLNIKVSATETLEQVLYEARELAAHAAAEQAKQDTPDPVTA
jgi:hypothetical protein